MKSSDLQQVVTDLLFDNGFITQKVKNSPTTFLHFEPISSDGSLRLFFRVVEKEKPICVGVVPHEPHGKALAEAHSAMDIGSHLFYRSIPVPEILAADRDSGLILFEDCGDIRLHGLFVKENAKNIGSKEEIFSWYKKVVKVLVHMQVNAAEGFLGEWCYETPYYDRKIMIEKEADYFLQAFWYSLLQGEVVSGIDEEFADIADNACLEAGSGFNTLFLHRDFQSRNIMISGSEIRIIDFQGGRFGPPGYDLASLLIDPYSSLSQRIQEDLLQFYFRELQKYREYSEKAFLRQYGYLKLQRNLQIVGAFSFLYKQRDKIFFKDFIIPALNQLSQTLANDEMQEYKHLSKVVEKAQTAILKMS